MVLKKSSNTGRSSVGFPSGRFYPSCQEVMGAFQTPGPTGGCWEGWKGEDGMQGAVEDGGAEGGGELGIWDWLHRLEEFYAQWTKVRMMSRRDIRWFRLWLIFITDKILKSLIVWFFFFFVCVRDISFPFFFTTLGNNISYIWIKKKPRKEMHSCWFPLFLYVIWAVT